MLRILLSFFLFSLPLTADAWGWRAHAAVARLAEANLTPAALAQAQDLLRDDLDRHEQPSGRKTLAAVASWADEIRDVDSASAEAYRGWHVRSNSVCSEKLGACPDGHCVDQLIIYYADVLRDRRQSARARNEALKWLVHLVGDLHMPLHSGINRNGGGARVLMEGRQLKPSATLHGVWDTELAVAAMLGWSQEVSLGSQKALSEDAPTQWMIETRDLALREAYAVLPGFVCNEKLAEPIMLDAAYQARSVAVIRTQIERAGLRLAQLLNQILQTQ